MHSIPPPSHPIRRSVLAAGLSTLLLAVALTGSPALGADADEPRLVRDIETTGGWPAPAAPGRSPAATLLLPYFEVDLSNPEGQTTLFSINNAGPESVVAHVVLWTDWGIPSYSFDVVLARNDVQTFNLRDIFSNGAVPETDGSEVPGCVNPVLRPPLDLDLLRRRHTGRPIDAGCEEGCLCTGSGRLGPNRATGYLTVDVVDGCAGEGLRFPSDPGYFPSSTGGAGFADTDNVLWGDVFYVAGADDSAQGMELVHLPYDAEAPDEETFYRRYSDQGADRRVGLGSAYRGRFFAEGGPFDGGTDLVLWLEMDGGLEPSSCGNPPFFDGCQLTSFVFWDEDEGGGGQDGGFRQMDQLALRLPVGSPELLPVDAQFGFFEVRHFRTNGCFVDPPLGGRPLQAWVAPIMKAQGRYSIGLSATQVGGLSE